MGEKNAQKSRKNFLLVSASLWLILFIGLIAQGILWELFVYLLPDLPDFLFTSLNILFTAGVIFYVLKLGTDYFLIKMTVQKNKVVSISFITVLLFILFFQVPIFVKSYFSNTIILPDFRVSTFIRAVIIDIFLFISIYYWLKKAAAKLN